MSSQKKPQNYINNKKFSQEVHNYILKVRSAREAGEEIPRIPEIIGQGFVQICTGLSNRSNFVNYTYKDECVADALEDCVRRIENFNVDAVTRSGTPNAFAYFTQIAYYAFLRRLNVEKEQIRGKRQLIENMEISDFITEDFNSDHHDAAPEEYLNVLLAQQLEREINHFYVEENIHE